MVMGFSLLDIKTHIIVMLFEVKLVGHMDSRVRYSVMFAFFNRCLDRLPNKKCEEDNVNRGKKKVHVIS